MFSGDKATLDKNDLRAAVRQLGMLHKRVVCIVFIVADYALVCVWPLLYTGMKLTNDEIDAMMDDADGSGRGKVDFTEFCSMMGDRLGGLDGDTLQSAFECFDTTSTGTISHDELRRILTELGPCKFTDKEVRELIKQADAGNGKLDYVQLSKSLNV
jgi:Ca2+-binding EF-hand superfamily protein